MTLQCTFLLTLFATITSFFHSHLNSHYHLTLSFQMYIMSLLFTICLIYFAYNLTLLSYLTVDQKCWNSSNCRLLLLLEGPLLKQSKARKPRCWNSPWSVMLKQQFTQQKEEVVTLTTTTAPWARINHRCCLRPRCWNNQNANPVAEIARDLRCWNNTQQQQEEDK